MFLFRRHTTYGVPHLRHVPRSSTIGGSGAWSLVSGLTNVEVNWQVVDTKTGVSYVQVNPQGTAFAPIQATNAFPTSCP